MATLTTLTTMTTNPHLTAATAPPVSGAISGTTSAPQAGFRPLRGIAWYKRAQAWAISRDRAHYDALVAARKLALLAPIAGTVLEIGPGAGANLPFFRTDVRWIGVEPNLFLHRHLQDTATRLGRGIELRAGTAERIPVPSRSVDAVVGTLVLCSVPEPALALREVLRVLRPGGRFIFMEHVAAARGTITSLAQRLMRPLWCALGDGCHIHRDTAAAINVAGFRQVDLQAFKLPIPLIGPHIAGTAWT